ncbi:MAG: hypothetical protein ACQEP9_04475 [Bacillota bacterium]
MRQYIGVLSLIYIVVTIVKLKDNKKGFNQYLEEYEEMKSKLKLVAQQKNPFVMMKFLNAVFYFFLFLYYIAMLVFFDNHLLINIITYSLILISAYRLGRKMLINSIEDFEETIKYEEDNYQKKQKLDFLISLVEFAYAFNALSLISFYY